MSGRDDSLALKMTKFFIIVKTPVKRSRTPVIPPSSVKISADGNLAGKLAKLSMQVRVKPTFTCKAYSHLFSRFLAVLLLSACS
jgi:hypothetical protein